MSESIQKVLTRRRPPRVKITYDVETGGAMEKKELPFIVGIFADLSGDKPTVARPAVKERKMVEVDAENFDGVMSSFGPGISFRYTDAGSGKEKKSTLSFKKLDDFSPLSVVKQFTPLTELFEQRAGLRDMQARIESDDEVELAVEALLAKNDAANSARDKLVELFVGGTTPAAAEGAEGEEGAEAPAPAAEKVERSSWSAVDLSDVSGYMPASLSSYNDSQLKHFKDALGYFTELLLAPLQQGAELEGSVSKHIDGLVARIDTDMTELLNQVLHHDNFQRLEASWRGLHHLVSRSETGTSLKLRVMNITRDELQDDLEKAVEFDQSHVFKLIYEAEYGTYGGAPYSLLVGDYYFGREPRDISLLEKIAEVAASAHAPFLAAVSENMFGLKSFDMLAKPRDLAKIFESAELNPWRGFRDTEDSRYVALTMPRVMLRLPYGEKRLLAEGLRYEEQVVVPVLQEGQEPEALLIGDDYQEQAGNVDTSRCLWGNPAWFMAERITKAFAMYGWTAAIRGVEGGGLLEGLPNMTYNTADGDLGLQCPTQVAITDRREKELNDLGFIAALHCKGTNKAAFFGGQTANSPKKYLVDAANANAQLSAMLPYVLAASRFAHYVKVIMRDKIGTFMTRANVERYLNEWIAQYVLLDDEATQDVKAAYPLREARVDVTAVPGRPGVYNATMFLKPHFQLEELNTSIRLVAELPS